MLAGLQRLGLAPLDVKRLLDLAERGEVLVELGLVGGAQPGVERGALVGHRRKYRASRHRDGVGGELGLLGSRKPLTKIRA